MLSFRNLTVSRGGNEVLHGLDGEVPCGQLIALIGENGAGKSTLLHSLAGQLKYSGEIRFHNKPLQEWESRKLAGFRSVLNQHTTLPFDLGVPELVAMGRYPIDETRRHCQERVEQYLQLMDVGSFAHRSTHQLSGGQLQRVQMARSLAQLNAFHPQSRQKLLLLDEPTSALDLQHQHRLLQITKAFVEQGNTAIVAIHDLNLASLYADSVILLSQGQIRDTGTCENVLTAGVLAQVYGTPMHVSRHPTLHKNMIFSEPQEISHEIRRFT